MKKFLKHALWFAAGAGIIFAVLSLVFHVRAGSRDNFYELLRYFENPVVQPTVLVVGDSRPAFAIRHDVVGADVYNFSFPSETYREMLLKAEYAIRTKPNIRAIVIPADYHMLSTFYAADYDAAHMFALASIADIRRVYEFSYVELMQAFVYTYLPLANPAARTELLEVIKKDLRGLLAGKTEPRSIVITPKGNLAPAEEASWRDFNETARAIRADRRIADHLQGGTVVTDEMLQALDELLTFAHKHGIAVIAVRYPVTAEYETRARAVGVEQVDEVFVARKDEFAAFLNYLNWSRDREDFFQDADHLNVTGAEAFSKQLEQDIRRVVQ